MDVEQQPIIAAFESEKLLLLPHEIIHFPAYPIFKWNDLARIIRCRFDRAYMTQLMQCLRDPRLVDQQDYDKLCLHIKARPPVSQMHFHHAEGCAIYLRQRCSCSIAPIVADMPIDAFSWPQFIDECIAASNAELAFVW